MPVEKSEILKLAERLFPLQVKLRRQLHRYPELSNEEFRTTALIKAELKRHSIRTKALKMKTGAIGIINARKTPGVAIRTDIDALPITERTKLAFKSKNEGIMHACGHDVHMAVVLGTAVLLNRLKNGIPGCVKFVFQPAEEEPPGGAERMIKEGVLKKPGVKMIFGLHTDPSITTGKIGLRDGPTMASVTDVDIRIFGRGGHAASPHRTVDAVAVASEVVSSVQKIVSREINPIKPIVITFGMIKGGTMRNVIADEVILKGTARTLTLENIGLIPRLLKRTVDGVCRARGAKYEINILSGYPVLSNHRNANAILEDTFTELFGRNLIVETPQSMGGEDFAFYLKQIPGAMFRLGVKNDRIGANKPWHSSEFIADERSIYYGTSLLSYAVCKYFEGL